jgi:hypothetical protein
LREARASRRCWPTAARASQAFLDVKARGAAPGTAAACRRARRGLSRAGSELEAERLYNARQRLQCRVPLRPKSLVHRLAADTRLMCDLGHRASPHHVAAISAGSPSSKATSRQSFTGDGADQHLVAGGGVTIVIGRVFVRAAKASNTALPMLYLRRWDMVLKYGGILQ